MLFKMCLLGPGSSGSNLEKHSDRGFSDARVNITRRMKTVPKKETIDGNYS